MKYLFDNIVNRSKSTDNTSQSSRYRRLSKLIDDEGNQYIETADDIKFIERTDDTYHIVTASEENRLDLVAYKYYNNPLLYWVIATASDIDDPLNVPAGTTLRIPSRQSLYGYRGVLI